MGSLFSWKTVSDHDVAGSTEVITAGVRKSDKLSRDEVCRNAH